MDFWTLLRVAVSLFAVLGVIWFLHKKIGRGNPLRKRGNPVTVISKQGIGMKASVAVIEAEGMRFVLGVTEHGVSVLHQAEAPEPAPVTELHAADESTFDDAMENVNSDAVATAAAASSPVSGSIFSKKVWQQALAAVGGSLK
jgi:flagellar protein FliO/FliZ